MNVWVETDDILESDNLSVECPECGMEIEIVEELSEAGDCGCPSCGHCGGDGGKEENDGDLAF